MNNHMTLNRLDFILEKTISQGKWTAVNWFESASIPEKWGFNLEIMINGLIIRRLKCQK